MVRHATFTGAIDKLDPERTNDSRWLDEFPKHTDYGDFLKTGQQNFATHEEKFEHGTIW